MARKRKTSAPPSNPNFEETQKLKIPKRELEEEDEVEEVEEVEVEVSDSEEEEEEESSEEEEEESSDEDDEETKKQNLRKLIEPFNKEQIIEFIVQAALKDPSIVTRIAKSAESDPAHRKIFVFGLGWDTTQEQLLAAFKPFGEIEECKLVTDKVTGRAKGYAFLQYKTVKAAKKALKQPQKSIGNRTATCQLSSAGGSGSNPGPEGRKLYVANVGPQMNSVKIKSFFAKYGEIEEGPIGIDSKTGKFKGYAIFVYKSVDGFKKALEEPIKLFDGVQLQCRPANKNPAAGVVVADGGGAAQAAVQQSGVPGVNYGLGVNPGFSPAALMMAQGQGMGLTNPLMGLSGNGFGPSMGYGISSMSPSVLGSYGPYAGPHAAFQGLGAYQSAQLGQSSAGATPVAGVSSKPQSSLGSAGISYASFGR